MSGRTSETADNPSGISVAEASNSIEQILARASGEPGDEAEEQAQQAEGDEPEAQQPDEPEEETQEEGDEPDPDAEGEEGTEDEDGTEEPDPKQTFVTVTVDGKAERLSLEEVTRGYLRTADYTRKTMQLAEERKAIQAHAAAVVQERQQYAALLPALEQQLKTLMPQEPEWDRLAADDPVEFNRQWAAKQLRDERMQAVRIEQQRLAAAQQAQAAEQMQQTLAEERQKLAQVNPAWANETRWKADRAAIREFGRNMGWSDGELSAVTDHRAVYALWLASQAHKALTQKPKPSPVRTTQAQQPPAAPAAARPGAARQPVISELTRMKQRLAKTNDLRDAASVIERLL